MKSLRIVIISIIVFLIGVLSALSFLRTNWGAFHPDFFFWASAVMTVISLLLLCFSIWQHSSAEVERKKGDAQVKIWMQDANGLRDGLRTIAINCITQVGQATDSKYSTVNDVGMAAYALSSAAQALYQSLYEERCITEEEYREQQKKFAEVMQEQQLKKMRASEQVTQKP